MSFYYKKSIVLITRLIPLFFFNYLRLFMLIVRFHSIYKFTMEAITNDEPTGKLICVQCQATRRRLLKKWKMYEENLKFFQDLAKKTKVKLQMCNNPTGRLFRKWQMYEKNIRFYQGLVQKTEARLKTFGVEVNNSQ